MERTWRWFGKKDKITLAQLKQIGVEGIVTALHDVPLGEVWTREKIHELKEYIESYGMKWSVVESLPVVETLNMAALTVIIRLRFTRKVSATWARKASNASATTSCQSWTGHVPICLTTILTEPTTSI